MIIVTEEDAISVLVKTLLNAWFIVATLYVSPTTNLPNISQVNGRFTHSTYYERVSHLFKLLKVQQ